jgi:hypothetical protein
VTFHCNVELCPAVILSGVAVKAVITGRLFGVTVIVAEAVIELAPLVVLRVYVVLVFGATDCVPVEDVVPIPWSIETDFAPLTFHCRVAV